MKKLKNLLLFLIILTNFSCNKKDTKIVCDGDFLNGKVKEVEYNVYEASAYFNKFKKGKKIKSVKYFFDTNANLLKKNTDLARIINKYDKKNKLVQKIEIIDGEDHFFDGGELGFNVWPGDTWKTRKTKFYYISFNETIKEIYIDDTLQFVDVFENNQRKTYSLKYDSKANIDTISVKIETIETKKDRVFEIKEKKIMKYSKNRLEYTITEHEKVSYGLNGKKRVENKNMHGQKKISEYDQNNNLIFRSNTNNHNRCARSKTTYDYENNLLKSISASGYFFVDPFGIMSPETCPDEYTRNMVLNFEYNSFNDIVKIENENSFQNEHIYIPGEFKTLNLNIEHQGQIFTKLTYYSISNDISYNLYDFFWNKINYEYSYDKRNNWIERVELIDNVPKTITQRNIVYY